MTDAVPDPRLLAAIARKRLIGLRFKDVARVAEPHDYGLRGGRETLLAWQLEPATGWRWFEIERMSDLEMLDAASLAAAPHHRASITSGTCFSPASDAASE